MDLLLGTNTLNIAEDRSAYTQFKETDFSKLEAIFRSIKLRITESRIELERKTKLLQTAEDLYKEFTTIKQAQDEGKRFVQIYIIEGATGVHKNVGRSSTDPDENMALTSILFLARTIEQIAVVCVPDEANCQHTLKFIEELSGRTVRTSEHHGFLEPGVIYVSSMASKDEMIHIAELTKHGREITILGPPLGEVHFLVARENDISTKKVNIMGTAKMENGQFVGQSTNTREKDSELFFTLKDLFQKVTFYSSGDMGKMTILFKEYEALVHDGFLLTRKDCDQWIANTREQFLGAFTTIKDWKLPGSMLAKRLDSAHILNELYGENASAILNFMKEDPGRRVLGFERFLEGSLKKLSAGTGTINREIVKLSVTAVDWSDENNMKQFLKYHMGSFQEHSIFKDVQDLKDSYQKCVSYIDRMSTAEVKIVLISILSALRNVYDEKTVDGWHAAVQDNGDPWDFTSFERLFHSNGKQVPYDTLVIYAGALGKAKLHENDGDKALLMIL